jgi:formylglycine-generating enzyme required for sulfatase activity
MKAMDVYVKNRYQSATGFKAAIEEAKTERAGEDTVLDDNIIPVITKVEPPPGPSPKPQPDKKKLKANKKAIIIAGVITELLVLFILIGVFLSDDDQRQEMTILGRQRTQDKPVSIDIPLVYVSGGTFTMGSTAEQGEDCYDTEKPAHQVTVNDFYIGKYEVTQAQWKEVMGSNPSKFNGDNLPVEQVSWSDIVGTSGDYMTIYNIKYYADGFIYKLNKLTDMQQYRLPTEAEWEYAARGGASSWGYKYSGSDVPGNVAWYNDNSANKTHSVGTKSANELGIYDMNGNVWEWCSDCYGQYNNNSQTNPTGSTTDDSFRVYRGGGWGSGRRFCRVSGHSGSTPDFRNHGLGFRLACSIKK